MATGRTVSGFFDRIYMDGLDISAYAQSQAVALSPLMWDHPEAGLSALSDPVQGALPGQAKVSPGTLNGIFDNTANVGLHALAAAPGTKRLVTLARGMRAAPALGDPCFTAYCIQNNYMAADANGAAFATVAFGPTEVTQVILFNKPWGHLLHTYGVETAVNTSTGADDFGAATTLGSWFWYHIATSNGTVTVKAQDAATNANGSFADVTGLTSGSVNATTAPVFGIVASAAGATLRQYTRWQIVFGTATTVTFVCGIVRITVLGQ